MKKKITPYILLVPQLILGAIFIIGLGTGIIQSFGVIPAFGLTEPTLKYYKEILTRPDILQSLKYSLYIAFVSAFFATSIGTILCAILVNLKQVKGKVMRVVQIPIIVPHVIVALFVINILSQNGILARVGAQLGLITDQQQFPMFLYDSHGIGVIIASCHQSWGKPDSGILEGDTSTLYEYHSQRIFDYFCVCARCI